MSFNDIPDYWSPQQALAIYEFLGDLQQRIWDRYELQCLLGNFTDADKVISIQNQQGGDNPLTTPRSGGQSSTTLLADRLAMQ